MYNGYILKGKMSCITWTLYLPTAALSLCSPSSLTSNEPYLDSLVTWLRKFILLCYNFLNCGTLLALCISWRINNISRISLPCKSWCCRDDIRSGSCECRDDDGHKYCLWQRTHFLNRTIFEVMLYIGTSNIRWFMPVKFTKYRR